MTRKKGKTQKRPKARERKGKIREKQQKEGAIGAMKTRKKRALLLRGIQDFASGAVEIFLHCGSSETFSNLASTL